MDSLLHWRFMLFGLAFAGAVYLQFFLAHRQWKRLKGEKASEIDVEYVRIEDYLPNSFRAKAADWLRSPPQQVQAGSELIIHRGRERIWSTGPLFLRPRQETADILVVRGDFCCGPDCRLVREVWALGDARVGAGTQLQAFAADGALVLEDNVVVARWLDSGGQMRLGEHCRVGARVTSRREVRLGHGSQVLSAFAPRVSTAELEDSGDGAHAFLPRELFEIGPPEGPGRLSDDLLAAGIETSRLVQLSPQCWSYLGDFRPLAPIRLRAGLVVRGKCAIPAGSVLSGDVKAHGTLSVGRRCECEGSLVSQSHIHLGMGCRFSGVIHAAGSLLLSNGTRGVVKKDAVVACAGEELCVEHNVSVEGKLASATRVAVVGPAEAGLWRSERRVEGD